jgi:tRNA-Thr(GGU) m(6)t(6)A37 methyltransferase TsaA
VNVGPATSNSFVVAPIGVVHGGRAEPIDDDWGGVVSRVVLDDRWPADALAGLDEFSHLEVVYVFDRVDEAKITVGARHPRGRADWPEVGIFAQRAKGRPNRIGVTTCEIVEVDGRVVTVRGLDAIDGTPVLDLKPYMVEFAPRTAVRQPAWSHELMRDYWRLARGPGVERADRPDGVVIERLDANVTRARAAFTMMRDVFDEADDDSEAVPLSDGYVARLLADASFWAIAAFEAGEPVGCITAHELPMTRHERTELFVYDLAVREDRQRLGIGRRLVDALVTGAAERGIDVVFVPADDEDTHALAFYERLGGRPAAVTMFDLGAG